MMSLDLLDHTHQKKHDYVLFLQKYLYLMHLHENFESTIQIKDN
jgi:hypothetical protein